MIWDFLQALNRAYLIDLVPLRAAFAAVNRADPAALDRWFEDHSYLRANDVARVAAVSLRTVRRWKTAAGILPPIWRPPVGGGRPRPTLTAPADWAAGTWLEQQYAAGHGIRTIARAVGRSYTATRRQLVRRGVGLRSAREASVSRHPCSARLWLLEHYVAKGWSLTDCARRAGVSTATVTAWLLRQEFRVRSSGEQHMVRHAARGGRSRDVPGQPIRRRTGAVG